MKKIFFLFVAMLSIDMSMNAQTVKQPKATILLPQKQTATEVKNGRVDQQHTIKQPPEVDRFIVISTPNMNTSNPYSLHPGQKARISAELLESHSQPLNVTITYSQDSPPAISGPSTVTIPAGLFSVQFDVTALSVTTESSVAIGGYIRDASKVKQKAMLRVGNGSANCDGNPAISTPTMVARPNSTIPITVSIPCAATHATAVQVTSSNPGAISPPPGNVVTIPLGATSATYTAITGNTSSTTIVTLSGHIPGSSPLKRAIDIQVAVTNSQ